MKRPILFSVLFLGFLAGALAQESLPTGLPRPRFLLPADKVPLESLASPSRDPLRLEVNINPPGETVVGRFAQPPLFEEIKAAKKSEKRIYHAYPHRSGDLEYFHLKDAEGNHWIGWAKGGKFNWVLWRGKRYWWRDPFAGHWLYYFQRVWWRADGQSGSQIQACLDGEYYLSDRNGKVLKDMGQDGNGSIVSAPGTYQGDLAGGGRARGRGHGPGGRGSASHGGGTGAHGNSGAAPPANSP